MLSVWFFLHPLACMRYPQMFKDKIRIICPQMFNYLIKREIPQRLKDITWTRYSIKVEGYNMKEIFHQGRWI